MFSAEPDGFGLFYGWAERNGERVRVDVLPPDHLWRGDIKLEGQKPNLKAWALYLDGEEFAPGLSISPLPKYVALWKRAQRAGVGGAWWRTVTLSMLNNLAASCGAFVLGVVFRLIWIWGVKRG